jgi:hypothetical protein
MIRKLLVLLVLLVMFAPTPAYATEFNSDTGFDNSSAWMLDPASPNLWTVSGSKANGNGATAMQMLMQMNTGIKEGHKYKYTLTVASRTTGILKVGVGLTMSGTTTFVAPSYPVTPVADNFTTANGLHSVTVKGTGDAAPDVRAAFRIFCSGGPFRHEDPIVYPGLKGRSHLHEFFGNTGTNANSNYSSLRSTGMTTCGSTTPQYPIDRAAYWFPCMQDGVGNCVRPNTINLYYKEFPDTSDECATPASPNYLLGTGGSCVNVPVSLKMIAGYNTATGLGGPADGNSGVLHFECWEWVSNPGVLTIHGPISHMKTMFSGGANACPLGAKLGIFANFPTCWDGSNLDTSDHRSHLAYPLITGAPVGYNKCDNAHPNMIPSIEIQFYFEIDANFVAGKWRLASDEMLAAAATDPGMTFHTDYWEAWSRTALTQINLTCWRPLNSCSEGDLGNGTAINGGGTLATCAQCGGAPDSGPVSVLRYEPTSNNGLGPPISSNGTFSGEITAAADGKFSLIGIADTSGAGFNGTVDNFSLIDITSGHHGPVTVHN